MSSFRVNAGSSPRHRVATNPGAKLFFRGLSSRFFSRPGTEGYKCVWFLIASGFPRQGTVLRIAVGIVSCALLLASDPAAAVGFLVIGKDPAGWPVAVTIANKRTTAEAYDEANAVCDNHRLTGCDIVTQVTMLCAAVAYNKQRGYSWATRRTTSEANDAAMRACTKSGASCVLGKNTVCDSKAEMTFLCIDPIFEERQRLRSQVIENPGREDYAYRAIRYLERSYCAYSATAPAEDRSRENFANGMCHVATGMHSGERVYWELCDAAE